MGNCGVPFPEEIVGINADDYYLNSKSEILKKPTDDPEFKLSEGEISLKDKVVERASLVLSASPKGFNPDTADVFVFELKGQYEEVSMRPVLHDGDYACYLGEMNSAPVSSGMPKDFWFYEDLDGNTIILKK